MAAGMTSIRGLQDVLKNIERARVAAVKGAERGVNQAMLAVYTTAKQSILKGPKTGIIYDRGKTPAGRKRKPHQASAPGQPPASDNGKLVESIMRKRDGLTAIVWTELEYGKCLEFGTVHIAPRPWLGPAVDKNKERFPKELGAAVIQSIDEAVKK
jgi:HK97 gp10 family phage protein